MFCLVPGENLPYICREVRCLDLEREARYHSSPRRQAGSERESGSRRAAAAVLGGRNRATPVKLRPGSNSGPSATVASNAATAPTALAQKPTAGAILSLVLYFSMPAGGSLSVVTGVIIITQTAVLSVNIKVSAHVNYFSY